LLLWLLASSFYKKPEAQALLRPLPVSSENIWETPPAITEPYEPVPHRLAFTRFTAPTNNGPISLLRFRAVLTGDRLPLEGDAGIGDDKDAGPTPWSRLVSERDVGINPTGDSFYLRNSASGLSTLEDGGTGILSDKASGSSAQ
jgi:hypothetical protein